MTTFQSNLSLGSCLADPDSCTGGSTFETSCTSDNPNCQAPPQYCGPAPDVRLHLQPADTGVPSVPADTPWYIFLRTIGTTSFDSPLIVATSSVPTSGFTLAGLPSPASKIRTVQIWISLGSADFSLAGEYQPASNQQYTFTVTETPCKWNWQSITYNGCTSAESLPTGKRPSCFQILFWILLVGGILFGIGLLLFIIAIVRKWQFRN